MRFGGQAMVVDNRVGEMDHAFSDDGIDQVENDEEPSHSVIKKKCARDLTVNFFLVINC